MARSIRQGPSGPFIASLTEGQILYGDIEGNMVAKARPAKIVNEISDFPAPISGVITLPAFTTWELGPFVSIEPNRIEMEQGSTLMGSSVLSGVSADSVTAPLISFAPSQPTNALPVRLDNLLIQNLSGPCFEFDDANGSVAVQGTAVACLNSPSIGRIGALTIAVFDVTLSEVNCADGLTLDGAISGQTEFYEIESLGANPANFTLLTATSNFSSNVFALRNMVADLTDVTTVGIDIDSGVTVARGLVTNCQFFGVGIPLATGAGKISPQSISWKFIGNQGIEDSGATADLRFLAAGAPPTPTTITITAQSEWVNAMTSLSPALLDDERFVLNGAGDGIVYVGLDTTNLDFNVSLGTQKAGAGNQIFGLVVVKNDLTSGGLVAEGTSNPDDHEFPNEIGAAGRPLPNDQVFCKVKTNDEFTLLVRNLSGIDNLEAFAAYMVVSKA